MYACPSNINIEMNNETVHNTIQEYVTKTTNPEDVEFMKKVVRDNIETWIESYSGMGFYKEENYVISDYMIFGVGKDKVLLVVYAMLEGSDDAEAKLLAASLNKEDTWDIRFTGMPSFYYEYSEKLRKGKKFSKEEIQARTFNHLIEDGLINFYDEISQDYIKNKWF